MAKEVTIILESELGKDKVEVDADLWKRFEAKAKKLEVDVRSLFVIALDTYLKRDEGKMTKLIESIGQAISREMIGKADTQAILFNLLKSIALKLEELERRIKTIEDC